MESATRFLGLLTLGVVAALDARAPPRKRQKG